MKDQIKIEEEVQIIQSSNTGDTWTENFDSAYNKAKKISKKTKNDQDVEAEVSKLNETFDRIHTRSALKTVSPFILLCFICLTLIDIYSGDPKYENIVNCISIFWFLGASVYGYFMSKREMKSIDHVKFIERIEDDPSLLD